MRISVLGTGMVGRAHAARLIELGHEVMVGTKDTAKTMSNDQPDQMGNPPYSQWAKSNTKVQTGTFSESAKFGELIINALKGDAAIEVLKSIEIELENKVIIDVSNPLDFSNGMPPSLFVNNTDSLGEQIQKALPGVKVVKTLNSTNAYIQVNPKQLANGDHHVFVSGNDAEAKEKAKGLLKEYGWTNIIDLGDITTARGTEMLLPIWLRLWTALGTPNFNFKIVVGEKA